MTTMQSVRAFTLALVAACGANNSGTGIVMKVSDGAPAYGDTPFPTDAVREPGSGKLGPIAGLERIATNKTELVTAHAAALDGFGLRPLVELFVDGPLDPATIPATTTSLDAPLALVDVDPDSPERGRVVPMEWRYFPDRGDGAIAGSPVIGEVLHEGTRYAAFATTEITATTGAPLRPLDTRALAPARWQSTADAAHALAAQIPGELAGLAVFTTEHASAPLLAARELMRTLPAPTLAFSDPDIVFTTPADLDDILGVATRAGSGPRAGLERWGNDNPTGIAHEHVGVIATGEITIARFRGDDTGTDLPDDETFQLDADGVPQLVAIEPIPITFVLPATPPPPDGYPVVLYGHGLGASRDQLLSFAEPLTSQGYALVGIDMFGHGSRYDARDVLANMSSQLDAFTGTPGRRDGFGDRTGPLTQFDFFESFLSVAAVRDSIRQSALDLSRVVQALKSNPDLSFLVGGTSATGLGSNARLDTGRIVYMGESFGTVVGTVFAAIEPDIDLFVLDVPGGGILDLILPASPEISVIAVPLIEALYDPRQPVDRWSPLVGLMQAAIDGADPLTYAPHVLRDRFTLDGAPLPPRHVVAIEVIGDQVLSNDGTSALARALGLAALSPHLDIPAGLASIEAPATSNVDGQTAVLVQYAPATHGANWSAERGTLRFAPGFPATGGDDAFPRLDTPITIANPIYETFDQVFEILASHRRGEPPRVIVTKPPTRDFDGDGVVDDQDADPTDPAVH